MKKHIVTAAKLALVILPSLAAVLVITEVLWGWPFLMPEGLADMIHWYLPGL